MKLWVRLQFKLKILMMFGFTLFHLKKKMYLKKIGLIFQSIFRFEFNSDGLLIKRDVLDEDNYKKIAFSSDKTKVRRDAYGITDQLYDAFTRGQ